MNRLFFYVLYKTVDCEPSNYMYVQKVKAWNKIEANEIFLNGIDDKAFISYTKVYNEVEYNAIQRNKVTL